MYSSYMTDISVGEWTLADNVIDAGRLPVIASVDVVVVGAGAAGVAAATVLGEAGTKVMVLEKYGFAGGAAVAGMSGTICGMYLASDSDAPPQQIVRGFTERFANELRLRGGLTAPQKYGKTYTNAHDPLKWRESADALMTNAGVEIMFHVDVVGVIKEGDEYQGVIVASNAGLGIVRAARVIDASGDAAVVSRGGGNYRFGADGRIQNPTMFFRLGGVDLVNFWEAWGPDTISPPWVTDRINAARAEGLTLPRNKIWTFDTGRADELLVNATRLVGDDGRMLNVIDPRDFTEAEIGGRAQVRAYEEFFRQNLPGCSNIYVVDTGVEVGIRQTRTIDGIVTLTNDDVVSARKADDGICRSPWPIELHDGERPKLHWILDDYYDVPYGTLVPAVGENVIVAGRCLSAEHEALASARVTAQCFEYGHAAAQATLLSLSTGVAYRDIDGRDVARKMVAAGSALSPDAAKTDKKESTR